MVAERIRRALDGALAALPRSVLPAPPSLPSEKAKGSGGEVPWWAQARTPTRRLDAWEVNERLERPEDDLFVDRVASNDPWTAFRPARRVRLRNGRPDPKEAEASLFATEETVQGRHLFAEVGGSPENMKQLAGNLAFVLNGLRWLRNGRAGAPVEAVRLAWCGAPLVAKCPMQDALQSEGSRRSRPECRSLRRTQSCDVAP